MENMTRGKKICTIGGGSGMPIVNNALLNAGYNQICSIVTTFDSGGDTGRMRTDERGKILAFSDYWRSLISLWDDSKQKEVWQEMLRFRDGRERNFGNIFFQFLAERSGGLNSVDELFCSLTGAKICGQVIPVSNEPAHVCFETQSGKQYEGEHFLDQLRMSRDQVKNIWLSPQVEASKDACRAIEESEAIIFCPGSMYGSLLVNLLMPGIRKSIIASRGKKILMTNIMSTANENHGFNTTKYQELFERYLGKKNIIDVILMADINALKKVDLKKVLEYYAMESSFPITKGEGSVWVVEDDIATIEKKNMRLRHSEIKLSTSLKNLIE